MRSLRLVLAATVATLAIVPSASAQNTKGIAKLEAARAARPNDAAVARSLGIAYYKAGKFADARPVLEQAVRLDPRDGSSSLYLGLTAEQQKDLPAAKAAYQTYVRFGRTSRVRRQLEARLAAITRQELEVAAKAAVAQEQQLSTQPGQETAIAVMPFDFAGPDSTLLPLERGFAELVTIDLARSSKLTVVERARIQALRDELALQRSGATDSATNVRTGKIIQAGRIVSGSIVQQGDRLRVQANITNTQTTLRPPGDGSSSSENTLEQLFAIEKAIVLGLFNDLGIVLTTAERNAIEERPTRSLQAFLAYSKGLRLEDEGKYQEASRSFGEAARLDPSFGAASVKSTETSAAAVGVNLTATSVEANLAGTPEGSVAQQSQQGNAPPASGNSSENSPRSQVENINSSAAGGATAGAGAGSSTTTGQGSQPTRDPLSSATGSESGRSTTRVIVIVRVPNNQ
jgi:tetratricopeptide (TPR) repeat protein